MAWTYNCWNPENNGKLVKCIERFEKHPFDHQWVNVPVWLTDTIGVTVFNDGTPNRPSYYWSEDQLLRIDGYEDDKSIEEITKELTA